VGRRSWIITSGVAVVVVTLSLVIRNQVKVYRGRQQRAAIVEQRQTLFDLLRPIALENCRLERFGEAHDGGYLMCGNLLAGAESAYSYGIGGYDKWGCDIATTLGVQVHQYDCFNTTQPSCQTGTTLFHAECVGDTAKTTEGRFFDTLARQLDRNGHRGKRIAMKMDVEGAEWDALLAAPADVLQQIEQMAVEFHEVQDEKYVRVVRRLLRFFHVAHIHFNNHSCIQGLDPFPTWAYEVLFVNKRLVTVDASRSAGGLHALDAPNNPTAPDCQPAGPS
jgi:hypothetical protein